MLTNRLHIHIFNIIENNVNLINTNTLFIDLHLKTNVSLNENNIPKYLKLNKIAKEGNCNAKLDSAQIGMQFNIYI